MKYNKIKLIREQTSEKLKQFKPLTEINMPFQGWIRSIRQSLGMNTRQLAEQLDVKRQRVSKIEKEEVKGNLTIETLRKAAEAMGCKFVYALIPETTLEDIVRKQAELVVEKRMKRVSHSMALEKQELSLKEKQKAVDDAVEKILHDDPGSIWDDKS